MSKELDLLEAIQKDTHDLNNWREELVRNNVEQAQMREINRRLSAENTDLRARLEKHDIQPEQVTQLASDKAKFSREKTELETVNFQKGYLQAVADQFRKATAK